MKKYETFVNEHIFSGLFGGKKNQEKRKNLKASDSEMIELLEEIESTFDIKNLKWDHSELSNSNLRWTYKLNGVDIFLRRDGNSKIYWVLRIGGKDVGLTMISTDLLQELAELFYEKEKEERIRRNTEIFSKVLPSRIDAEKYNL